MNSLRLRGIVIATGSFEPGFSSRIAGGDLTPRSAASGTSLYDAEYTTFTGFFSSTIDGSSEATSAKALNIALALTGSLKRPTSVAVAFAISSSSAFVDIRWTEPAPPVMPTADLTNLTMPFASRGPS